MKVADNQFRSKLSRKGLARSLEMTISRLRLVGSVTECYGDILMYGEGHLLFSTDSLIGQNIPNYSGADAGSSPVKSDSCQSGGMAYIFATWG